MNILINVPTGRVNEKDFGDVFMEIYPLKFRPIYKHRIWGGQKLREFFNKDIPASEKIGESWELADLPDDKSIIDNGELAGETLAFAIENHAREIVGDENFSGAFPLLIKFLDAQDILSVQVHPDRQTCERSGKGNPKTECWYIVAAKPGAVIYKGLKKGVTRNELTQAVEKGNVEELLVRIAVKAGECHYLPAGTTHAIGGGLLIAEIQMPSDTTYRLFDWNRVDESGKPRQLHIREALDSIHFDSSEDNLSVTTTGRLVDSEYFKIDKHCYSKGAEQPLPTGEMRTLLFLGGSGDIFGKSGRAEFTAGDCLLIPFDYEGVIRFNRDSEYLAIQI